MTTGTTPTIQLVLDLVGVFVFALSGGLVGVRARLDVFGVLVLSWISGLGGGIIRDVLLGATPPVGVSDWRLMTAALTAGLAVFATYGRFRDLAAARPRLKLGWVGRAVRVLDAGGLAVFAVSGALKAVRLGAPPLTAILVGGITAIGGGLLRDVLVGQVPEVLQRELYALPALLGAGLIVAADRAGTLSTVTIWLAVTIVFAMRMVAVVLDLNAPQAPGPRRRT